MSYYAGKVKAEDITAKLDKMKSLLGIGAEIRCTAAWLYSQGINSDDTEIKRKTRAIFDCGTSNMGWGQDPFYQTAQEQGLDDKDFEFW